MRSGSAVLSYAEDGRHPAPAGPLADSPRPAQYLNLPSIDRVLVMHRKDTAKLSAKF